MIDLPPESPPAIIETVARSSVLPGRHSPPNLECFVREAERNDLDPYVLLAVMQTENGRPGEVARNRNGTYDLGAMSVNTVWLPKLAKQYQLPERELEYRLASNGCANVAAGAWILRQKIVETGDLWEGVARYHSRTVKKQAPYLMRVHARLKRLLAKVRLADIR